MFTYGSRFLTTDDCWCDDDSHRILRSLKRLLVSTRENAGNNRWIDLIFIFCCANFKTMSNSSLKQTLEFGQKQAFESVEKRSVWMFTAAKTMKQIH